MYSDPFGRSLKLVFDDLRARDLWRARELRRSATMPHVRVEQEDLLSFSSNDYLGLANDPRVTEAFCEAARRFGVGSGASHLLGGHTTAHHDLEEALADFVGTPRALLFSTGYMANLALLSVLSGRHHVVFEDRRNHASLIDAVRLADARRVRYRDVEDLGLKLPGTPQGGLIVSDGVFSMDGDIAAVPTLFECARRHDLGLILDEAHAFGVVGPEGRGTAAYYGMEQDPRLVRMGTLGKAFGVFGAFVAGSAWVIEALIQKARPSIYTTALPPAVAHAAFVSLAIARSEEYRRVALHERVMQFQKGVAALGLSALPSTSAIQGVVFGGAREALAASAHLRAHGLLVSAVRPPTVPAGTARLRITFSAAHSVADVERLLAALATLPEDLRSC